MEAKPAGNVLRPPTPTSPVKKRPVIEQSAVAVTLQARPAIEQSAVAVNLQQGPALQHKPQTVVQQSVVTVQVPPPN